MVLKQFQAWREIFKTGGRKIKGVTIGPKGGPLEKNSQNMSLSVQNDCFDEKKRFGWF